MSWQKLKTAFERLLVANVQVPESEEDSGVKNYFWRTTQALSMLGHCDFDFEDSKVRAAAPVLARLPLAGLPQVVLAGARSPTILERLEEACKETDDHLVVEYSNHDENTFLLPQRASVQAGSASLLASLAERLGIRLEEKPPALNIASYAGSLGEYVSSLPEPKSGELRTWPSPFDFNGGSLRFEKADGETAGVKLVRRTDPVTTRSRFFLIEEGKRREVDRDWGRYVVLSREKVPVLSYDRRRFVMAVPIGASLPSLFGRALALCSGYAPQFVWASQLDLSTAETRGYRLYRWVPPQMAEMVAGKLDQRLLEEKITHDF